MSRPAKTLTFGQHLLIVASRMLFGALMTVLRLFRGPPPSGWQTVRYGLMREETLDYIAAQTPPPRRPVVFIHGGAWLMGNPGLYSHDLAFLAEAGHPVFSIGYPKAPEHQHPKILRSVFKALMFIRMNFPQAERVHFMGDSAGANLAVMAAVLISNPQLLAPIDPHMKPETLPSPASVTSIYGVLDRGTCLSGAIPFGVTLLEAYGGPDVLGATVAAHNAITPTDLAFSTHPPCLLVSGNADPVLGCHEVYGQRLREAGHAVSEHVYAGAIHGFFNLPDSDTKAACRRDILAFLAAMEP